jgi:hypothetical protein
MLLDISFTWDWISHAVCILGYSLLSIVFTDHCKSEVVPSAMKVVKMTHRTNPLNAIRSFVLIFIMCNPPDCNHGILDS